MKKTLFVLSILALVTLASCGNNNLNNPTPENPGENNNNNGNSNNNSQPEEKTIPVYQGMEAKDSASSSDKKSARKYYSDMEVGTDQIDYYAEANSDFYLHIHIYNPEQFEILSFTLNDYKYQSYQFEEGSTGSLLILKLKTPLEPGYHEYFLSNIKYIDGTEIKDVDMSEANKSVKIGVQYMEYPTFELTDEQIGYEKYSGTFIVQDYQDIYLQYGATISVSKDDKVVFEKDYTDGTIYLQLDNLETNSEYFVEIHSEFETFKGNGIEDVTLYSDSFTTENGVEIVATTNKRDASFEVNSYLDNFNILTADLYKDGALITGAEDFANIKFDNLYSNSAYELVLTYEYGQNYYHGEERLTFTTKEVTKPSAETEIISSSKNSVEFKTDTIDSDNTIKKISYELYDGSKLVDSSKNETMFDGLLSNHSYGLKTIVTYDLYNGEGNKTIELNDTFTTQKNNLPTVTIGTISPSYESVDFDFEINDTDKVVADVKVNLLDNGEIVKTGDENTRSFHSLYANHDYEIQIIITYDLRDGGGEKTITTTNYFRTQSYATPDIYFSNIVAENGSIEFKLNENDEHDLAELKSIDLYENDVLKETKTDFSNLKFDNLSTGVKYNLVANYNYDSHDGSGEHLLSIWDNGYATIDGEWTPYARQLPENIQAIRVTEDRVYGVFFLGIPEEKRMAFWDAQEMCETYGGHLITITSDEELQIAQDLLDEQNSEINNTAGSLVGGYYENGSWHWVTGEEFVVNRDHFYYPGTIGPSEGDVLATWFESAKFWYQSPDTKNPAVLIKLEGDKPTTGIYLK